MWFSSQSGRWLFRICLSPFPCGSPPLASTFAVCQAFLCWFPRSERLWVFLCLPSPLCMVHGLHLASSSMPQRWEFPHRAACLASSLAAGFPLRVSLLLSILLCSHSVAFSSCPRPCGSFVGDVEEDLSVEVYFIIARNLFISVFKENKLY